MTYELPTFLDDGLITQEIGAWGQEKYRLLNLYAQLFSASMKNKWDCLVYIDLFAGSGSSKIKGTNKIVAGSPLVALGIDPTFDRYVFCEKDPEKLRALKARQAGMFLHTSYLKVGLYRDFSVFRTGELNGKPQRPREKVLVRI
jgi:hypothetical protein